MPLLLGTEPNQVPTNGDLGTMAFQDRKSVNIQGGTADSLILGGITPAAASVTSLTATALIKPQQATTIAAPAYVNGAIYFDTTLNKLRVGGATAWETVTST